MHPLIKEMKFLWFPKVYLDPAGDRFNFEQKENLTRGNRTYYPPIGWIRYGLKVTSIYPDCSKWLSKDGNRNEWPVAYQGFKLNPLRGSLIKKLFDKDGKFNPQLEKSKNMKFLKEIDMNPASLEHKQPIGIGIFCSEKPEIAENNTNLFIFNEIKYKMLLQCRVDPQRIRIPKSDKDLFIINQHIHIRPYGILIKEID